MYFYNFCSACILNHFKYIDRNYKLNDDVEPTVLETIYTNRLCRIYRIQNLHKDLNFAC